MQLNKQIAKDFRAIHFGGNWTSADLKTHLSSVSWEQAIAQLYDCNTIATLAFHMNYYVSAVLKVLQGGPLVAKDIYSFDQPPIQSQKDWDTFLEKCWSEATQFAALVEQLPEAKLWEDFTDPKYGNYYSNLTGIIEHSHYHLGQVVLIKKILGQQ